MNWGQPYEDIKISYPDASNKKILVIEQHMDEGAFGNHYRTIKAYQLFPGIRIILDKKE